MVAIANPTYAAMSTNTTYQAYFKSNSATSQAIEFINNGFTISTDISTSQFHYAASAAESYAIIGMATNMNPLSTTISLSGQNATYTNAFANTNLIFTARLGELKEMLTTSAIYASESPSLTAYLEYAENVYYTNTLAIWANGVRYYQPSSQFFNTQGEIAFTDPGNITEFYLPAPMVHNSGGSTTATYRVDANNGILVVDILVPISFVWNTVTESPNPADFPIIIDPTTVGTSTTNGATAFGYEDPVDYANGNYWVPSFDGTHYGIWSSTTLGGTYSEQTYTTTATPATDEAAYTYSGTTIYRATISQNGACTVYVDSGTLNSGGTISWGTETSFSVSGTYCTAAYITGYPTTVLDSSGNWWVALSSATSGAVYTLLAYECATPLGSCTWTLSYHSGNNGNAVTPQIISIGSAKLSLIWINGHADDIQYSSGSWGTAHVTSGVYGQAKPDYTNFGSTTIGCGISSSGLTYMSITAGGTSWTETVIDSGVTTNSYGCGITSDGGTANIGMFYEYSTTNVDYAYSSNSGSSWTVTQVLSGSESTPTWFGTDPTLVSGTMVTSWTETGGSSPFSIRIGSASPFLPSSYSASAAVSISLLPSLTSVNLGMTQSASVSLSASTAVKASDSASAAVSLSASNSVQVSDSATASISLSPASQLVGLGDAAMTTLSLVPTLLSDGLGNAVSVLMNIHNQGPSSNLVDYWPVNEGSGTVATDLTGDGNTGTLVNGTAYGTGIPCPYLTACIDFNGAADNSIVLSHGPGDALGSETLYLWVYPTTTPENTPRMVTAYGMFLAFNSATGYFCFYQQGASSSYFCSNTQAPVNAGSWLAATYNSGTGAVNLYLNTGTGNMNVGSTVIGTSPIGVVGGDLGSCVSYCGSGGYYTGYMAEVHILNSVQTLSQLNTDQQDAININQGLGISSLTSLALSGTVNQAIGIAEAAAVSLLAGLTAVIAFMAALAASISLSATADQDLAGIVNALSTGLSPAISQDLAGLSNAVTMALSSSIDQDLGVAVTAAISLSAMVTAVFAFFETLSASIALSATISQDLGGLTNAINTGLSTMISQELGGLSNSVSTDLSSFTNQALGVTEAATTSLLATLTAAIGYLEMLSASISLTPAINQDLSGITNAVVTGLTTLINQDLGGVTKAAATALSANVSQGLSLMQAAVETLSATIQQDLLAVFATSISLVASLSFSKAFYELLNAAVSISPTLNQDLSISFSAALSLLSTMMAFVSFAYNVMEQASITLSSTLNQGLGVMSAAAMSIISSLVTVATQAVTSGVISTSQTISTTIGHVTSSLSGYVELTVAMAIIAGAGLIGLFLYDRRKRNKQPEGRLIP